MIDDINIAFNLKFERINFNETPLTKIEYENCTFTGSIFSKIDFGNMQFTDCDFTDCDLSMTEFNNTALRGCSFTGCKMIGSNFTNFNKLGLNVEFNDSKIDFSTFAEQLLSRTKFIKCSLIECDFSDTDLSQSVFEQCDLGRTIFINTNIEKADFRTSFNYQINPNTNRIKGAKFSRFEVTGLLDCYNIVIE